LENLDGQKERSTKKKKGGGAEGCSWLGGREGASAGGKGKARDKLSDDLAAENRGSKWGRHYVSEACRAKRMHNIQRKGEYCLTGNYRGMKDDCGAFGVRQTHGRKGFQGEIKPKGKGGAGRGAARIIYRATIGKRTEKMSCCQNYLGRRRSKRDGRRFLQIAVIDGKKGEADGRTAKCEKISLLVKGRNIDQLLWDG